MSLRTLLSLTCLACALSFGPTPNLEAQVTLCSPEPLSLSSNLTTPVALSNLVFWSEISGSEGSLVLKNLGERSIVQVLVVIDLLDLDGKRTNSVYFYSVLDDDADRRAPYGISTHIGMRKPLARGRTMTMFAVGRSTSTATCPFSAKVTSLEVQYSDLEWKKVSESGWSLPPRTIPSPIDRHPVPGGSANWQMTCDITIGSGNDISIKNCSPGDELRESWLKSVTSDWRFASARVNGSPTEYEVRAIIWVSDHSISNEKKEFRLPTDAEKLRMNQLVSGLTNFVFITLTPVDKDGTYWRSWWGNETLGLSLTKHGVWLHP